MNYVLETYEGAKHGFAVTGHLVYDREASERHWQVLLRSSAVVVDTDVAPSTVPANWRTHTQR